MPITCTAINRLGQLALAMAKGWVGEADALQMLVTLDAVRFLLLGPTQKQLALLIEKVFQFSGCEVFTKGMLCVAHHVEIHHG